MTKKKQLTDKQKLFLDVLFSEANGDLDKAKKLAGYSDSTVISDIAEGLSDEIIDLTKKFLAMNGPKAALGMVGVLSTPASPGVANALRAAEQILDRAGIVKHEKIDINSGQPMGLFVLPPKGWTPDTENE